MLSLLPNASKMAGGTILILGPLAPIIGAAPIYRMAGIGTLPKVLLFGLYYVACAVGMFVVGWASLGLFGLTR